MTHDQMFRFAAVVAAIAILAAPYRQRVVDAVAAAADAAKSHAGLLVRGVAALLLIAAAWGKVPLPQIQTPGVRPVAVAAPSDAMQRVVAPVAESLRSTSMANRALWADLWLKAGVIVAADAVGTDAVFHDTKALRDYTAIAVDIGWRRIGGNPPGSVAGLRQAVEGAFEATLGADVLPVSADTRARYDELAKALAWAAGG